MKEIAWIGSRKLFEQTFHTNRNIYIDTNAGIKYVNIARSSDLLGRRFDDVQPKCDLPYEFGCYDELYALAKMRIKNKV